MLMLLPITCRENLRSSVRACRCRAVRMRPREQQRGTVREKWQLRWRVTNGRITSGRPLALSTVQHLTDIFYMLYLKGSTLQWWCQKKVLRNSQWNQVICPQRWVLLSWVLRILKNEMAELQSCGLRTTAVYHLCYQAVEGNTWLQVLRRVAGMIWGTIADSSCAGQISLALWERLESSPRMDVTGWRRAVQRFWGKKECLATHGSVKKS